MPRETGRSILVCKWFPDLKKKGGGEVWTGTHPPLQSLLIREAGILKTGSMERVSRMGTASPVTATHASTSYTLARVSLETTFMLGSRHS